MHCELESRHPFFGWILRLVLKHLAALRWELLSWEGKTASQLKPKEFLLRTIWAMAWTLEWRGLTFQETLERMWVIMKWLFRVTTCRLLNLPSSLRSLGFGNGWLILELTTDNYFLCTKSSCILTCPVNSYLFFKIHPPPGSESFIQ